MHRHAALVLPLAAVVVLGAWWLGVPGPVQASQDEALDPAASDHGDSTQEYLERMRTELSQGKVGMLNEVLRLTEEQHDAFWPIYADYEQELFSLGEQRISLAKRLLDAQAAGSLDDAVAVDVAAAWFDVQARHLELAKTYHDRIARAISPIHAAQFTQLEHRATTVVELMWASRLPMIHGAE